jgi:ribosomal protein S20
MTIEKEKKAVEAYKEAIKSAWKACEEAIAPAKKAYEKAIKEAKRNEQIDKASGRCVQKP